MQAETLATNPPCASEPSLGSWRRALAQAWRDPAALAAHLGLDPEALGCAPEHGFATLVTREFASRMRPGDAADPLLRQVLPQPAEGDTVPGFGPDPVAESEFQRAPGLLQKYHGRALLVTSPACAIHCRYCFRRHYPYGDVPRGRAWWQPAVAGLRDDPTTNEIILSGGDPLSLNDGVLAALVADLAAVPQLKRLRIHTRLPIVLPQRVDAGLLEWLADDRFERVVVVHANHANEIDDAVVAAAQRLHAAGVTVLNQAVLLAGVNDSADALVALSERLFAGGILPYYLHQLDPVAGAAHFAVSDDDAHRLWHQMHGRLPGYLLPRLAREEPGQSGKTWLTPPV